MKRAAVAALLALTLAACAKSTSTKAPDLTARPGTPVDSVTVALWRMDETLGTRVADAGPHHLDATAGLDTRPIFGRFRGARSLSPTIDSFLYVPYDPALDLPNGLSIECWIAPNAYPTYEDWTIASRWAPQPGDHSWIFGLMRYYAVKQPDTGGPAWHDLFVQGAGRGRLMFVFQPEDAGAPLVYYSLSTIEVQRWTHVAVTYDGQVVRFWVDGQPDGTYAATGRIRPSQAPLLVGNYFDTRFLTTFGGDLRQSPSADQTAYYAFDGGIDELRISSVARTEFALHGGR